MSTDPRDQIIAHLIAQNESQRLDLRAMRAVHDDMKEELAKRKAELAKMNDELKDMHCLLYTSPSPRDRTRSRMPSSA